MTEEKNNDPARKMRTLLSGGKASPGIHPPKKDVGIASSLIRLPKKGAGVSSSLPKQEDVPDLKKPASQPSPPRMSVSLQGVVSAVKGLRLSFGPPFWTIASIVSLTVNIILVIVLLAMLLNMKRFNAGNVLGLSNDLLGGLYTNFEKMDRAHITTTIPVETTIPVKFDLQLNQQTNVVLSQDVTIDNALVTVNTGGLNITRALTTIVLPQGTSLPVVLNLTVPVDTTVPVKLTVNVDIPLAQTQLHEPFFGLQNVVKPFYCIVNPNAVNLDGQPVCK